MTRPSIPPTTKASGPPETAARLHVGREFLDVTWRMAVPVLLFAGLGLLADRAWGSQPWLTLLGTLVGFYFAALLVKRQIGEQPAEAQSDNEDKHNKGPAV